MINKIYALWLKKAIRRRKSLEDTFFMFSAILFLELMHRLVLKTINSGIIIVCRAIFFSSVGNICGNTKESCREMVGFFYRNEIQHLLLYIVL